MVKTIQQVVSALDAGGIRTRRGYPQETYIRPETPVATVNLHSADADSLTLVVEIFALSAAQCENQAWQALELLSPLEGVCSAGRCQYHRNTGLFSLEILVRWETQVLSADVVTAPQYTVYIDDTALNYVTGFSAESTAELYRLTAEDGTEEILRDTQVWVLTVEELFSPEIPPGAESEEYFTLAVTREGGTETYSKCKWESIRRTETAQGVLQVRTAKSWEARAVS